MNTELNELRILVIEDDPDARDLMLAVLEDRGACVEVAESVGHAFELLETIQPDVIVSDIGMPEEDGLDFIRRLRALPAERTARTPAIAVSAFTGTSDRARGIAAGFDRYLHKPVDFDELCATIRGVTSRGGPEA